MSIITVALHPDHFEGFFLYLESLLLFGLMLVNQFGIMSL